MSEARVFDFELPVIDRFDKVRLPRSFPSPVGSMAATATALGLLARMPAASSL
jgi:hypothetical protein